jgi:SAM-dependent methyltransferase/GT2 family glycosyltransferase
MAERPHPDGWLPLVSVILPVRDEGEHLDASLGSVLAQDWPADRLEVVVVDGRSHDGTPERAVALADAGDRSVEVLDNPDRIVPTAMNLGLACTSGDVVVRVDGHCSIPPDYVRRCVELLEQTGADCVGGVLDTVGTTDEARAIAAAQSHVLGVGPARFRTGADEAGPVDTLAFGAYRREVFDRIGTFDEELVRNQDDELNLRLTRAGGTIWLDPSLVATYTSRATFGGLWRQYEGYGSWKVRVAQKHGGVASWRHLVPAAFVAGLAGASALALLGRRRPLLGALAAYGAALGVASGRAPQPLTVRMRMPAAFAVLHLAYGIGTWRGAWRWRTGWISPPSPVGLEVPATSDDADLERRRVEVSYQRHDEGPRAAGRWDPHQPGNRAMLAERDAVLARGVAEHPVARGDLHVLDVGCGRGDVLASLVDLGLGPEHLVGVDVREEAVAAAGARWPELSFRLAAPGGLPVEDCSADLVLAFTVFSSVHDGRIARELAAEVERVLAPGGALVWYDLRVPSPGNPEVRPWRAAEVAQLFPGLCGELQPVTLLPPLARRLGPLTGPLYPRLAVGPLRTHLVGVLRPVVSDLPSRR